MLVNGGRQDPDLASQERGMQQQLSQDLDWKRVSAEIEKLAPLSRKLPVGDCRGRRSDRIGAATSSLLWRFSDAGMARLSPRSDDRRPKSAKARSRGRFGTGVAAGAMGI